jgi:GntR family transcriptional regulator
MTSTSSPIRRLDPADPTALHEQAAAQLRRAIAEGQAAPGERLPPAGDLAAVLGVNRNTVLRALRLLREEGVVEFRRGRGITVTAAAPQAAALVTAARDLLVLARRHGYHRDDLIRLIQTLPDP